MADSDDPAASLPGGLPGCGKDGRHAAAAGRRGQVLPGGGPRAAARRREVHAGCPAARGKRPRRHHRPPRRLRLLGPDLRRRIQPGARAHIRHRGDPGDKPHEFLLPQGGDLPRSGIQDAPRSSRNRQQRRRCPPGRMPGLHPQRVDPRERAFHRGRRPLRAGSLPRCEDRPGHRGRTGRGNLRTIRQGPGKGPQGPQRPDRGKLRSVPLPVGRKCLHGGPPDAPGHPPARSCELPRRRPHGIGSQHPRPFHAGLRRGARHGGDGCRQGARRHGRRPGELCPLRRDGPRRSRPGGGLRRRGPGLRKNGGRRRKNARLAASRQWMHA